MEDYVGKICPFCKTEIKEGDAVKVCPACGTPHHEACWEENKGCNTPECAEQHHEPQEAKAADVCAKCGTVLTEGQAFCPTCGTPKNAPKPNVCAKCGAELVEGQQFCANCGQKVGSPVGAGAPAKIGQINAAAAKKFNSKLLIPIIAGGAVLVLVLVFVFGGGGGKDFNKTFADIADESWCYISSDGSYMAIDTNPYDIDNYTDTIAYHYLDTINKELGFSSALWAKMGKTSAMDGIQTESNDNYTVSWKFHPDSGMEVTYEYNN